MKFKFIKFIEGCADYLFIEQCRNCQKFVSPSPSANNHIAKTLCPSCFVELANQRQSIEYLLVDYCRSQSNSNRADSNHPNSNRQYNMPVISRLPYEGLTKKLIYNCKYDNDRLLAHDFACLMQMIFPQLANLTSNAISMPILMPIPLHWRRELSRGFNQSELMAKHLRNLSSISISNALKRKKNTKAQHDLNAKERFANTEGAFFVKQAQVSGKNLILVDDIYTSGATLISACRTLLEADANSVTAFTLSRAVFANPSTKAPSITAKISPTSAPLSEFHVSRDT